MIIDNDNFNIINAHLNEFLVSIITSLLLQYLKKMKVLMDKTITVYIIISKIIKAINTNIL